MNPLSALVPAREFAPVNERSPRAAFILGSPRSGTTLLRTMLSGHPDLFVPPELGLLDRGDAMQGDWRLIHDLHRIKEIHSRLSGRNVDESFERLSEFRSVQEIYEEVRSLAPGKLLVDKTPRYSIDPVVLARAEEMFDGSLYVWITRHPAGVVHSWNGLFPMFFWGGRSDRFGRTVVDLGLTKARTGELTWRLCNENIEKFLATVPHERQMRVKYEDIVKQSEAEITSICEFLGVKFHSGAVSPFDGDPGRMIDIPGGGDLRFSTRNEIVHDLTDSWQGNVDTSTFDDETKALALRLGYEV